MSGASGADHAAWKDRILGVLSLLDLLQGSPLWGAPQDPEMVLLRQYEQQYPFSGDLFQALRLARNQDPQNILLRNAEHAAFAQTLLDAWGPVLGPLVVGTMVPAYSGFKAGVQQLPAPLSMLLQQLGHRFGSQVTPESTPASLDEVRAGLSPLFRPRIGQRDPELVPRGLLPPREVLP